MRVIEADNTYALQFDEKGEIKEGMYLSKGTSIITTDEKLKVNNLTTTEVDWAINHAADNDISEDVLQLELEPRSTDSDLAVEKLVAEGKLIITNE